jgi:hypothetical protein
MAVSDVPAHSQNLRVLFSHNGAYFSLRVHLYRVRVIEKRMLWGTLESKKENVVTGFNKQYSSPTIIRLIIYGGQDGQCV